MRVLIIEDESRAANHLERMLLEQEPDIQIIQKLESVRKSIDFLEQKPAIDLIFADIQLGDGLSFEIFKTIAITCPIIFTTAFDQYAIEAFKTNGIDYLLKPIEEKRLKQALLKAKQFSPMLNLEQLASMLQPRKQKQTKNRFMVKAGDRIKSISIDEITAFYSLEKSTFILTRDKRSYAIDYALDDVYEKLDASIFFKINRKYIIAIDACSHIVAHSNSRLKLSIPGLENDELIVAREKVQEFKNWLDK
jgi:DNA-binding LytR/AlgR family response regulator